jgi:hypothetical protein
MAASQCICGLQYNSHHFTKKTRRKSAGRRSALVATQKNSSIVRRDEERRGTFRLLRAFLSLLIEDLTCHGIDDIEIYFFVGIDHFFNAKIIFNITTTFSSIEF